MEMNVVSRDVSDCSLLSNVLYLLLPRDSEREHTTVSSWPANVLYLLLPRDSEREHTTVSSWPANPAFDPLVVIHT